MNNTLRINYSHNSLTPHLSFHHHKFEYNCIIDVYNKIEVPQVYFYKGILCELNTLFANSNSYSFVFDKIRDIVFELSYKKLSYSYYNAIKDLNVKVTKDLNESFELIIDLDELEKRDEKQSIHE